MRKKIPTAIALLCIIVYVTAVLFAAYRVYNSVRRQTHLAGQELDGLREFIFQSGPEFLDRDNREKILKRMAESKTLEGIIITGSFGSGLTFEREKGKVITGEGGRYSFKNGFGLISLPARQVAVRNFRNVNIYSQNNIIDYPYFITVLKQTLMAVLAALTLSF
ncbi:MAG: hypothetical protein LBQ44_00700, partial [Treponema sp.]|nr:hypothetical protein [Treponema sp.]